MPTSLRTEPVETAEVDQRAVTLASCQPHLDRRSCGGGGRASNADPKTLF